MLKRLLAILALVCAVAAYGFAQNSNSSTTPTRTRTTTPKTTQKKPATTGAAETSPQAEETTEQKSGAAAKRTPSKNEPTVQDVDKTFEALVAGINHTNVETVTGVYWKSPQLVIFNNNGSVTKGWEQLHTNRASSYPNLKDVNLEVRDKHIQMLGRDGAVVTFLWTQSQTANGTPETATGRTTLVFRRVGASWKVVHAHTSPDSPDQSRVLPSERATPTQTPAPKTRP